MVAKIDKEGMITIEAETPLESFALNEITKKWKKPGDMENNILVKTGLKEE